MKRSLHERVAMKMAMSFSVGSYHSYDTILAHLRIHHTEQSLLELITGLEEGARLMGAGADWKYLDDEDEKKPGAGPG
jgi:hypothetical protein